MSSISIISNFLGARLIAEALADAHNKNVAEGQPDNLQVVVFGRNRMESPGATHLAKALALYADSLVHIQVKRLLHCLPKQVSQ